MDTNTIYYYTRMTNQRLVLCAVEYPFLPSFIAMLIELFAKPKRITYVWKWEDIKSIEMPTSSKKVLGLPVSGSCLKIEDESQTYIFVRNRGGKKVLEFWNNQTWKI